MSAISVDIVKEAIAMLKAQAPALQSVAGSAELESAVSATRFTTPAGFVVRLAEVAGPNERVTGIMQRVTVTFAVVLAVGNAAQNLNETGSEVPEELKLYRDAVINAVLGWQASPDHDPATFRKGSLVQVNSKVLWWQDEFETAFYITK